MKTPSTYFTNKIAQSDLKWRTKLEFFTTDKTSAIAVTLSDEDLIENTLQIESQTTGNENFILGGISASLCKFNINVDGINKLNAVSLLKKKTAFRVKVWLKTDDPDQDPDDFTRNLNDTENTSGRCVMGIFYIDKIQDNGFDTLIEAYDGTLAFDVALSNVDLQHLYATGATITGYMQRYADTCSEDNYSISADTTVTPDNNTNPLYYSDDITPQNYREVLGYLSQIGNGFMYMNEDGDIAFKKYSDTAVASIPHTRVFDYSQGNETFQTRRVTVNVAAFNVRANSSVIRVANRAEMFYNEIPFLRYMFPNNPSAVPADVQTIVNSMLTAVENLLFTSGSYETTSRPDFEIGDKVSATVKQIDRVTDQIVDKTYSDIIICKNLWKYQTYSQIQSLGYAKASANKQTQNTSKIKQQSEGQAVNATVRKLGATDIDLYAGQSKKLFTEFYILQRGIESMFTVTCTMDVTVGGTFALAISLDGVQYITRPKQVVADEGYHTFSYTFGTGSFDYDGQHSLQINIVSTDTFEASILANDYQLLLTASAVQDTEPEWTGIFEVDDIFTPFELDDVFEFGTLTDATPQVVIESSFQPVSRVFTATQFTVDTSVPNNTASLRNNSAADDGKDWDNLGNVYVDDVAPSGANKITLKVSLATSASRVLDIQVNGTTVSSQTYRTGSYSRYTEYTVITDYSITGGSSIRYTLDGHYDETSSYAPLVNHLEVIYSE